jgi:hypothetical protein
VNPQLDRRKETLTNVATCTCYIAAKYSSGDFAYGTAFLFGPTTLLTAGQIYKSEGTEIVAQHPGVQATEPDIRKLFSDASPVEKFQCSVVVSQRPLADILILHCSSYEYTAKSWVTMN